jgi:hypothetical protein
MDGDKGQEAQQPREDMARPHERPFAKARRVFGNTASKAVRSRAAKATGIFGASVALGAAVASIPFGQQDGMNRVGDAWNDITGQTTSAHTEATPEPGYNRNQMAQRLLNDARSQPNTTAYFENGGKLTLDFTKGLPNFRTSTETYPDGTNPSLQGNLFNGMNGVSLFDGTPVEGGLHAGLTLTIDNPTFVMRTDIAGANSQKWFVFDLELNDRTETVFLKDSRETEDYIHTSTQGQAVELDHAQTQEIPTINQTHVATAPAQ